MTAVSGEVPHLKIRPPARWTALSLRDVWLYRDLLTALASRDVKLRYRQTALGVIWVLLQPLLAAGIFAVVFGRVAKIPNGGLPPFLFAYAGMLGWQAFNSTLTKASACIVQNSHLVSKVYFPRLILPLSTVFSTLIDFAIGFILLVVLLFLYGVEPGLQMLLLPIWLTMLVVLAIGLGLYTSALMVSYRDLQYAIPVLMQFLLYASPVAYSVTAVPETLRVAYYLNPLSGLLEAFRWSALGHGELQSWAIIYAAFFSIGMLGIGAIAFKRMERAFADII